MITIESKRIGKMEVNEDRIIHFQTGVLGFKELRQFILADDPQDVDMPFKWLISIEDPEIVFLVTDPGMFFKDYIVDLSEDDRASLELATEDDASVLSILTVPENPKEMTANLRGPLVINWKTFHGKQLVLKSSAYRTRHLVFEQTELPAAVAETSKSDAAAPAIDRLTEALLDTDLTPVEAGEVISNDASGTAY